MTTKVIVTNRLALDAKYGESSPALWQAVDDLITADLRRGIPTRLVAIDDRAGPAGVGAVDDSVDWVAAKTAVDAVATSLSPDYLMLLGGPDVIPHCVLENPAQDDDGPVIASDLPYACDSSDSGSVSSYLAPKRVISRLPDVPAAGTPDVIVSALEVARDWTSRDRSAYDSYLGISAEVWSGSTQLTLVQLFGDFASMQTSPDAGPVWDGALLSRRSHFVNLHGAPSSHEYLGQRGKDEYPVGHDARLVDGRLAEGTVVSAECCYGAELYEPLDGQLGMAFAYLRNGAYGFFGSTTIAWGNSESPVFADVICRLFHSSILAGASVGRAGLEARQNYLATTSPLDPLDLKTIAQFVILGDPSVQPVATPELLATETQTAAAAKAEGDRSGRRTRLQRKDAALGRATVWADPIDELPSDRVLDVLRELTGAKEPDLRIASFEVRGVSGGEHMLAFTERASTPAKMHLLIQTMELPKAPIPQLVAVVALEEDGLITSIRTGTSR